MMCQGLFKELTTEAEQEALRAVEMLRHLPVAVCALDLKGNVIEQNPEALAVFGCVDKTKDVGTASDQPEKDVRNPKTPETNDPVDGSHVVFHVVWL